MVLKIFQDSVVIILLLTVIAAIVKIIAVPFSMLHPIIIHQTHYEKSDWSRAFNQFTIVCELDMINAISAAEVNSTFG